MRDLTESRNHITLRCRNNQCDVSPATGGAEIAQTDAAATLPNTGAANPILSRSTFRGTKRKALEDDIREIELEQRKMRLQKQLAELKDDE